MLAPFWKSSSPRANVRRLASTVLLISSACLAAAGCGGINNMAPATPTPVVIPASAQVTFCPDASPTCTPASAFSLSSLRDLNVMVAWQNLQPGHHSQTVQVFLPDGNLYQAFEQSFEIADGAPGAIATAQALPVAGTWITQHALTGAWQVTLQLDGQAMSTQGVQLTN
ncbi:MAG TPA: hypothetical protein VGI16_12415 [Candidatus Acidoferrum sp.]|jgi:hypothetical protein